MIATKSPRVHVERDVLQGVDGLAADFEVAADVLAHGRSVARCVRHQALRLLARRRLGQDLDVVALESAGGRAP